MIILLIIVGPGCVLGVMLPITPKGANSSIANPFFPDQASGLRYSIPGLFSAAFMNFEILCSTRPILVSSTVIAASSSLWSIDICLTASINFFLHCILLSLYSKNA